MGIFVEAVQVACIVPMDKMWDNPLASSSDSSVNQCVAIDDHQQQCVSQGTVMEDKPQERKKSTPLALNTWKTWTSLHKQCSGHRCSASQTKKLGDPIHQETDQEFD